MGAKQSHENHPEGKTMKAVVFKKYGSNAIEQLTMRENQPLPVPSENEVLIKVYAASINPIDKLRVEGKIKALRPELYDINVLGYDASGVIVQSFSDKFKEGDEVYTRINPNESGKTGTFSEFIVANEQKVALKPKNISFEEAASMPLVAMTALQAMRRGNVQEGSKVFITGGAGGVGTVAIQIAKALGASFVATTASATKIGLCKELGADKVINYREEDFVEKLANEEFDFVFDTTHESAKASKLVKNGGKVITIADTPTVAELERIGLEPNFMIRMFLNLGRNKEAIKNTKERNATFEYHFLQPNYKDLNALKELIESEKLLPVLDSVWDFHKDWENAIKKSFSGRARGKVVMRMLAKSA